MEVPWGGGVAAPTGSCLPACILGCSLGFIFNLKHRPSSFCFVHWRVASQAGVPRPRPPAPATQGLGEQRGAGRTAGMLGVRGPSPSRLGYPSRAQADAASIAPSAEPLVLAIAARLRLRAGGPPPNF